MLAKVPMTLAAPDLDASLYWVENVPRISSDQLWHSDFLNGKEVNREALLMLNDNFRVLSRFSELIVDQRYAISSDGLVIDSRGRESHSSKQRFAARGR